MKKFFFFLLALCVLASCGGDDNVVTPASDNNIVYPPLPDSEDVCSGMDDFVFARYCYDKFDVDDDGKVSQTEAAAVTEMDFNNDGEKYIGIKSLKGICYFTNLESIRCCGCESLEEADLSANLKISSIEGYTFGYCKSLTNVILPNSVISIGNNTFYKCESLASIKIPNSVTSIGIDAFAGCASLSAFHGKYASEDHRCLINDDRELLFFAPSGLTGYTIPDGVVSIRERAFYYNDRLKQVSIPESVVSIGDFVFFECNSLTNVYCRAAVPPTLGMFVFDNTYHPLPDIEIYVPDGLVSIYKNAAVWSRYADQIVGF